MKTSIQRGAAVAVLIFLVIVSVGLPAFSQQSVVSQPKDEEFHSLSFSRLILRPAGTHDITIADEEFRIMILEELRKEGFHAFGAENLLFNRDDSHQARFVLGGVINKLECKGRYYGNKNKCQISVDWELFEPKSNIIVYKVTTRTVQLGRYRPEPLKENVQNLVLGALHSLMNRPLFKEALRKKETQQTEMNLSEATFKKCDAAPIHLPEDMDKALKAAVVIKVNGDWATGSGFFVSPNGLIITANHVVDEVQEVEIQTNSGLIMPAVIVRRDRQHDVALLKVNTSKSPCLNFKEGIAKTGSTVFGIGSPVGTDLAFSVSRGIVSGFRMWEGQKFIQTDASLNPGNSGGPLIDSEGNVVAIVSGKIIAQGIEGIAFGIPISHCLDRLNLKGGEENSTTLSTYNRESEKNSPTYPVIDSPDPSFSELDKRLFQKANKYQDVAYEKQLDDWEKNQLLPIKKKRLPYIISIVTLTVGGTVLLFSGIYTATSTLSMPMFDLGLSFITIGAASVMTGLILIGPMPNLPPKPRKRDASNRLVNAKPRILPLLGATSLGLRMTF